MMSLGLHNIQINTSSLADGHSIAAYLTSAAGTLLTHTTVGSKQALDVLEGASHVSTTAYSSGTDYLSGMGVVDSNGNWVPFTLNAAGELPVSATVNFAGDYATGSAHTSTDVGLYGLTVRRDTRAVDSGVADGDYASFSVNATGELWTKDADVLAQLVLIKGDTASIVTNTGTTATNTGTIATNTGTTATNTGNTATTLSNLSKAEDAAHASGDQGIQALAVRKDSQGSNAADGDYTSLQTWSEGSLKVVDVANGALLQQQVTVGATAAAVPTSPLANRKTLMLQNVSNKPCWIGSSSVTISGATTGIQLSGNSFIELEVGPAVSVYAIRGGQDVTLNVMEMA